MHNSDIARAFERIADLLEIQSANPFRVRAYRNAARLVRNLPRAAAELVAAGEDLTTLPGIGKDLAAKIAEIVATGRLAMLDELARQVPPGLAELLELPALGPKRVHELYEKLGIATLADLDRAMHDGLRGKVRGIGPKTAELIERALARRRGAGPTRRPWIEADAIARALVADLARLPAVASVDVAGSLRRRCETVGDIDLLVTGDDAGPIVEHFVGAADVAKVVAAGPTRAAVVLASGMSVDLRVVPIECRGAALHYFTGSKPHNIALRTRARRRGLRVSEYGVFRGERRIAGREEAEVFASIGLPWIPPELREDRGEFDAAAAGTLPVLVEESDIRGDLHVHTRASDGRDTILAMAEAAKRRGYAYLAISDHAAAGRVARGLDPKSLRRHLAAIRRADAKLKGIRLLASAEVEILEDGSLDLPDELLTELDLTIGAMHLHPQLSSERQTERVLRAMDHPRLHILAHPTGRLRGRREPFALDLPRVLEGARERGCCLELNCQPDRMDLDEVWCRAAKAAGVLLSIASDAHAVAELDFMRAGVGLARRGWLERGDVLNARSLRDLRRALRRA